MIRFLGILLAVVFAILSLFHIFWAAGGRLGGKAAIPTANGERLFNPSTLGTILVAAALLLAMLVVLGRIGVWGANLPAWIFHLGASGISLLFLLRAIGDFHYLGFFKSVSETDFARWDTWLFSPLCLFIAVVAFLINFYKAQSSVHS
jgi:hypothetical protein